jgi:hypothetical protein
MKNYLSTLFIILLSILFGCEDNPDLTLSFTTDKGIYMAGDEINLTMVISTENPNKKEISVLSNLENVELWLMFVKEYELQNGEETTVASEKGITNINLEKGKKSEIKRITITKGKPFKVTWKGEIRENENEFIIDMSEHNYIFKIDKSRYKEAIKLNIHGYFHKMNAILSDSFEDYFKVHEIILKSK